MRQALELLATRYPQPVTVYGPRTDLNTLGGPDAAELSAAGLIVRRPVGTHSMAELTDEGLVLCRVLGLPVETTR